MKPLRIRAAAVAVLLGSLMLAPLRTADAQTARVPVDKLLPPDVYVYFTAPNATEFKKRFNASSFGELINDKAFAEFRQEIEVAIKKGSAQFEQGTGLKLGDVLNLPSGEFAVAVAKSTKPIPNVGLFLDFGKNEETLDKIVTAINKVVTNNGVKRTTVNFEDTRIVVYTPPFEDEAKKMEFAYFIKGSMFVLTNNVDFSKAILARWDGKHESTFAKSEVYSYISSRTKTAGRDPVFKWYIDPLGLVNAVISNNPSVPAEARIAMTGLSFLGVTKFKAIGGSYDVAVGEFDSISKSVYYVDLPTTGILNLFQFPATTQAPPKWVPQSATAYGAMNWDMQKAYKSIEAIVGLIPPGGPDALDKILQKFADDPNGPGIHVKKDLLDHLSGSMTFYTDASTDDENPAAMRIAFGLGVKNADKISDVLTKIAKLPAFPGKKRDFKEHAIYEIDLATFGAEGKMGVGLAKGHLFICSNVTMLEKIILANDNSKSLADSTSYQTIAAKFPAKTSMVTYQASPASQIKPLYKQLREKTLPGTEEIPIDFSKLPPFSALEKYLQPSGGYTIPDKHGAYSESFSLKRAK